VVVLRERAARPIGARTADQGFKQVVNLKGGMRAWRAEHLPVARD
jgi:rhodanese-related sulfurtransferase